MTYLLIYLLCGAVAFWWVVGREKASAEDALLLPLMFLSEPSLWLVWLFWPIALPVYRIDLLESARLRREIREAPTAVKSTLPRIAPGSFGIVMTRMNPTGIVEVEGHHFEARAEDGFIDKDEPIFVVRQSGAETIVRKESNQPLQRTATSRRG